MENRNSKNSNSTNDRTNACDTKSSDKQPNQYTDSKNAKNCK